MEDILASIRRIIADDQGGPRAPAPPLARTPPVPSPDDVLDLADPPPDPRRSASQARAELRAPRATMEPPQQPEAEEFEADDAAPYRERASGPELRYDDPRAPLLSPTTDVVVSGAFNALASTILANNARTIEDLVRDMLKPMLKAWLDDNLPTLVERLVRAEIERVARGRS